METKNRIVAKAQLMFAEHGIKAITMDQLANELGISKRTVYIHFKDKNELVATCIKVKMVRQMTKDEQLINDAPNSIAAFLGFMKSNIKASKSVNPEYYCDLEKYYPAIWNTKIEDYNAYRKERIATLLRTGMGQNVFRKDIDIEAVSTTIFNIYKSVCSPDIFPDKKFSQKKIFINTLINYTRGIASEKGLKIIENYEQIC